MSAVEALDIAASAPAAEAPELYLHGLYEGHSNRIFGFCVRRLSTREEAEDAVQTTFMYALRALQRGVRPVSETAWLFKIAQNVCLSAHRTNGRRRERELADSPELEDPASNRENGRDAARELVQALSTIPRNQQRALLLREWRGLSYREISVQLGVSVAAVETLIFRARRGVAKSMSRERLAGVFDLGAILNMPKSVLGSGATAAKLVAGATLVTGAALPAADSPEAFASRAAPAVVKEASPAAPGARTTRPSAVRTTERRAPAREAGKAGRPGSSGRPSKKPAQGAAAGGSPGNAPVARPGRQPSAPLLPAIPPVKAPELPPVSLRELPPVPGVPELPRLPVDPPQPPVQIPAPGDLPLLPDPP